MNKVAELADIDQASATWTESQLRIQVVGEVQDTCWTVGIEQTPLDVWPPEFAVIRRRTSHICTPVQTRYLVAESFALGTRPESVVVHHSGGETTVPVETGERPDLSRAAGGGGGFDEAEGRSRRRFSFDEAFANAVEALPSRPSQVPDWMETVVVTQIHAELGGIAGSRDLVVTVRRPHPPS